ncbi:hypothetical protein D9M71_523190 [compost metagenome]
MILLRLAPLYHAGRLHAHQHTGHARLEDAGQLSQAIDLQFIVLTQDPNHPPLLLGQAVLIQRGTEKPHRGFASLEQCECQ